jgi:polar amino acid transport system substrate-binding protein
MLTKKIVVGFALLGAWWGLSHGADTNIAVQYRDKPPYSYTKDDKPAGFLMERTVEIFKRANLGASYEEAPVKRITQNIQKNGAPLCSPGWYKLSEREVFALFSLPIHEDKPHLVLVGSHALERARTARTLKELFANPELKLGEVSGASYGAELDNMIGTTAQTAMDSTVTPLGMAKMIKFKRADYMLIDEEDYSFLNQRGEVDAADVKPLRYVDMPPGLKRYIMCSKSVGADVMERINTAIRQLALPVKP